MPNAQEYRLLRRVIESIKHGGSKTVRIPGLYSIGRGARSTGKWLVKTRPGNVTLAASAGFATGWRTRTGLTTAARKFVFGQDGES